MTANRRDFIKFVVAGAVAAGCPIELTAAGGDTRTDVDGEHNEICHQVRDGHRFVRPASSSRHDVIIAGGGVSGLTAAHLLRDKDFLLLEKEPHWGGNAYLESYHGAEYATGAAFVESPPAAELSRELGLEQLPVNNFDGAIVKGEFIADCWGEGIDRLPYAKPVRESFKRFRAEMNKIRLKDREDELDQLPLSHFLKGYPPELLQWWDCYGPSNWGTKAEETSSLVALEEFQWMSADNRTDDRLTLPGGLGAITRKLSEMLLSERSERMRAGATIVAVVPQKNAVEVTYAHEGQLKTATAKAVIMATPKFITARVVEGMPEAQKTAIHKMRYVPYPVVNLVYDKPVFNQGYDTWCPGNRFTDLVVADWVIRNQPGYKQKYNILTAYTPLAENERGYLLTTEGSRLIAEQVLRDFRRLLPGTNVDPVEVQIYRRGHPMYKALPGNYTNILPLTRKPMERISFANTDSEGPVSTTSTGIVAARRAVGEVNAMLSGASVAARHG